MVKTCGSRTLKIELQEHGYCGGSMDQIPTLLRSLPSARTLDRCQNSEVLRGSGTIPVQTAG